MHHITKSLFVGAAIAGIGMSSGKAEIVIGDDVRQRLQDVAREMLQSHRLEVNMFHEEHKTRGSFNYSDGLIEEDVKSICAEIYGENMPHRSFIELLNGNGRCDFFKKGALKVFLRYRLCDNILGSLDDFKREYGVFVEDSEDRFLFYPFTVQERLYDFVVKYHSTEAEPKGGLWVYEKWSEFREKYRGLMLSLSPWIPSHKDCVIGKWLDFCEQHKGLRYFADPDISSHKDWVVHVTSKDIRSRIAGAIFSGKYITKIEEILYEEIRRQLRGDKGMMMRFVKRMCNTDSEKEICRFVAACFCQYKKIKKAIDTDSVTLDTENMYERFLDVECRLRSKLDNKRAPLVRSNATKFSEFIGNPVFLYMYEFLESMKADIANVPELVKLFNDPVYWAPTPISEAEGANILNELEDENNNGFHVNPDAPNAFLEEID